MNHTPPGVERDLDTFVHWFLTNHIDRFDLAVQRRDPHGRPLQFLAPRHTSHQNLSVCQLYRLLPWLRAENTHGADIYFRAHHAGDWPLVFLDDIPTNFARRIAHKYTANVLETSRDRTHLWLATSVPLSCSQRGHAQKYLVLRLQGLADVGSVSGEHWGRLPGMRNRKPFRNTWVNLYMQSQGRPWSPSFRISVPKSQNLSPKKKDNCHDPSREEWGWVMGSLENGVAPTLVLKLLIEHALPRRARDTYRYAYYTVRRACQKLGLMPP